MENAISNLSTIFSLIGILLLIYGALSIHRSIKSRGSLFFLLGVLLFPVAIIVSGVFDVLLVSHFLGKEVPEYLGSLFLLIDELLPQAMLVIAGFGMCSVAAYVKNNLTKTG